ncbi:MAG: glycosyltransferase family 2 protein [Pseudomonadota bacterium]
MRNDQRVVVVIPALNEEAAIGRVLDDLPAWIDQVVVADNGSTDKTAAVARAHGADVVHEPQPGYGAACLAGIAHAQRPDIVAFIDGDYSDHGEQMDRVVDPIARGEADLVIGSRVTGNAQAGSLTIPQRFGNQLACTLMRWIWGTRFTDLGPFRAVRATSLEAIGMRDRAYGWTVEMQIKAAEAGLRLHEVPVDYRPRIGVSKVSGTVKGTVLAGTTILRIIGQSGLRQLTKRRG